MHPKNFPEKSFTIIELLVVVAVIGVLASGILASVQIVRAKARDAKRLHDMEQIVKALQIYYDKYNRYPSPTNDPCCSAWDQGPCDGNKTFINALVTEGLMAAMPTDPSGGSGNGCYGYEYDRFNAGNFACDAGRGAFFVLGINDMETSDGPHPDSPGWSCPNRNFQDEFDWVVGEFEY